MISYRINHIYLVCVSIFSAITLFLHMVTLKLVYKSIEILLEANEITSLEMKKEMALQVDNLKRYSNYCTNCFFILCYLFLIFTGIILMLRKIKIKIYLLGDLIFGAVQVIGLYLFIQIFNKYELTEGFSRLRIIVHHKLFWIMVIIPIIFYLLYGYLKKHEHS